MGTSNEILRQCIYQAIAHTELDRSLLNSLTHQKQDMNHALLEAIGQELFRFFRQMIDDPPLMAYRLSGKHYQDVGNAYFQQWVQQTQFTHNHHFYEYLNSIVRQSGEEIQLSEQEIRFITLRVLMEELPEEIPLSHQVQASMTILESFGKCCNAAGLIDSSGLFLDPHQLLEFFL